MGGIANIQTDANFTIGSAIWGRNPSLTNFSPRIGFAWDVFGDGKTSLKGGFGLLYDVGNFGAMLFQSLSGDPPLYASEYPGQSWRLFRHQILQALRSHIHLRGLPPNFLGLPTTTWDSPISCRTT